MLRGVARLRFKFTLTMAAYDLVRLPMTSAKPDAITDLTATRSAQAVSAYFSGLLGADGEH
jgi:hypothetical protein